MGSPSGVRALRLRPAAPSTHAQYRRAASTNAPQKFEGSAFRVEISEAKLEAHFADASRADPAPSIDLVVKLRMAIENLPAQPRDFRSVAAAYDWGRMAARNDAAVEEVVC